MTDRLARGRLASGWPWLALGLAVLAAGWYWTDFEGDPDGEFPAVVRPTFSPRPAPAYRLAEAGDTLDKLGIYLGATAVVVALWGAYRSRRERGTVGLWPAAVALGAVAGWHAATAGPWPDGWHGLGWRNVTNAAAPMGLRAGLAAGAILAAVVVGACALRERRRLGGLLQAARERGALALLVLAAVLVPLREVPLPASVEPAAFWPKWAFVWGLLAFVFALGRLAGMPTAAVVSRPRLARLAAVAAVVLLVAGGRWLVWYQRPIPRLKAVVPGKIYISAMPDARGLELAQRRHGFKSIINLFPEDTHLRSPLLPQEEAFVREHGLTYLRNTTFDADGDAFLRRTLELAQDPDAWPVLVHCHACMDRTPAWAGIYRFVVEGKPLREILCEIEQHRGYRPKASVTLLYNHVLPKVAPDRAAGDPTAQALRGYANGTPDPYAAKTARAKAAATMR
jgi:protein tyrosine phosphatase (PTP) superfamily phosphohydrolase (DUF442 family)